MLHNKAGIEMIRMMIVTKAPINSLGKTDEKSIKPMPADDNNNESQVIIMLRMIESKNILHAIAPPPDSLSVARNICGLNDLGLSEDNDDNKVMTHSTAKSNAFVTTVSP
jgi:hypothetical protein